MVLRRRAPCGTGVVDEDVDMAEAFDCLARQPRYISVACAIRRDPACIDALSLQRCAPGLELVGLARGNHDTCAHFSQARRDLRAEAARAAGYQRGSSCEVE